MDVSIRTEKTIVVAMTEPQARNMLRLARAVNADDLRPVDPITKIDITGTLETLNDLRQALLSAGLTPKDSD